MKRDLMAYVRRAETLVGDFISEGEDLLSAVEGTDVECFECFDELRTALGAMAGVFTFRSGHPKESGEYLAISEYGTWYIIRWSERHKMWNCFDEDDRPVSGIEDSTFLGYFEFPDVKEYVHVRD